MPQRSHPFSTPLPSSADLGRLLRAMADGDLDALRALYDGTAPLVFGILYPASNSSAHAEQAAERVYLGLWRSAPLWSRHDTSCALSMLLAAVRRELVGGDRPPG